MHFWRSRCLQLLVAGASHPRRTAAAFGLGTFLSFSPLLGLQIAVGLSLAYALRLSRPAVLVGLCMNLPWIMVPWYTCTTMAGAWMLGTTSPADIGRALGELANLRVYSAGFWHQFGELVWAYFVGTTVAAGGAGLVAYFAASRFLARRDGPPG